MLCSREKLIGLIVKQQNDKSSHVNLKLNKDKCHFRCTSVPFIGEVISRPGVQPDPQKLKVFTDMPPLKMKKGAAGISCYF